MTTPPPQPKQTIHTACPTCGRGHDAHPEFGSYCNLHCLTLAMDRATLPPLARTNAHA